MSLDKYREKRDEKLPEKVNERLVHMFEAYIQGARDSGLYNGRRFKLSETKDPTKAKDFGDKTGEALEKKVVEEIFEVGATDLEEDEKAGLVFGYMGTSSDEISQTIINLKEKATIGDVSKTVERAGLQKTIIPRILRPSILKEFDETDAKKYLNEIKNYDALPLEIKAMLVDIKDSYNTKLTDKLVRTHLGEDGKSIADMIKYK